MNQIKGTEQRKTPHQIPPVVHTPAPWSVEEDSRPNMEWNRHIVSKDTGHAVCFMAHSGGDDPDRDKANARLVATAPELLASLKEMRDACAAAMRVLAVCDDSERFPLALELAGVDNGFGQRADAAVAKAMGLVV